MRAEWMETLLQISLSTAAVIGVLLLLVPLWQRRYSARWRKVIWLVLAVRLLVPVSLELPQQPVQLEMDLQAATVWQSGQMMADGQNMPEPAMQTIGGQATAKQELMAGENNISTTIAGQRPISRGAILAAIWLLGAASFLLWHGLQYGLFRRKALQMAQSLEDGDRLLERAAEGLQLRYLPEVVVSGMVQGPMLLGFRRPVILLPSKLYGERELNLILRHELTHHKLHDLWYKLLLLLANAVHWFNPLVWLMVRQAGRDVEQVCDEQVVQGQNLDYRKAYSMTILHAMADQRGIALSTSLSKQAQNGKKRFAAILYPRQTKKGVAALLAVVLLAVMASGCLQVGKAEPADPGLALYEQIAPWLPEGAIEHPEDYEVIGTTVWEPAIANGQSYYWREEKADGQGIYTSISADGGLGPMYHYKRELQVLVSSDGEILDLHYSSDADGLAVSEAFLAGCDLTYAEKEVQALIPNGKQLQFVKQSDGNGYRTYISENTLQDYRYKVGFIDQGGYQQYLQKYYDNPEQLSQLQDWLWEQFHQQMQPTFYLERKGYSGDTWVQSKQGDRYMVELKNYLISWWPQFTEQQWAQLDTLMETDPEGHQFVWDYLNFNYASLHSFRLEAPILEDGTLNLEQAVAYPVYDQSDYDYRAETPLDWQQEAERWQMLWAAAHFAQGYTERQQAMMDFFGQAKQLQFAGYDYNTTISYLLRECDRKSIDFAGEHSYTLQIELPNETQSHDYLTMTLEQMDGQWQVTDAFLEK